MPVTTTAAAVHITPVVIHTFVKHYLQKTKKRREGDGPKATDDILFDEAFHIVKSFVAMGMQNTVESLQGYTNTHVPSPYWITVVPVMIPLSACNKAAEILIQVLGDDIDTLVGGKTWWQVRGLDGVQGEWVVNKADHKNVPPEDIKKPKGKRGDSSGEYPDGMDKLGRVMLYIHGGGFYWGSINTHRYQIGRFARKIGGRAFAVNYRKAPQYPWPCPLQDCLAAYLYLISPPPTAPHAPIPSRNIVIAGDSAGGNLALSLLTIIRDMALPRPAGAVLISPWVDLTHSFPSVMGNTITDIIPEYGFIHKPSSLWPLPPVDAKNHFVSIGPAPRSPLESPANPTVPPITNTSASEGLAPTVEASADPNIELETSPQGKSKMTQSHTRVVMSSPLGLGVDSKDKNQKKDEVMSKNESEKEKGEEPTVIELRSQIQLYATNEQLTHPLVSPLLHGSLGDLPPLYILAGDGELLRDEVVYLAHRASNPEAYPLREELKKQNGARGRIDGKVVDLTKPTKVHLQVYDGMCHVLTVFTFVDSAHYAYNSIADFCKRIIDEPDDVVANDPFPPTTTVNSSSAASKNTRSSGNTTQLNVPSRGGSTLSGNTTDSLSPPRAMYAEKVTDTPTSYLSVEDLSSPSRKMNSEWSADTDLSSNSLGKGKKHHHRIERAPFVNSMIRERVSVLGIPRPMEPASEMSSLQIPTEQVGMIKEAPVRRWLNGLGEWDRKFSHTAKKVRKERERNEVEAKVILDSLVKEQEERGAEASMEGETNNEGIRREEEKRYGPLDLFGEFPPPSAICGRRDTVDALILLRTSIYHATQNKRPLPNMSEAQKHPMQSITQSVITSSSEPAPLEQSAAEQQVSANKIQAHGVAMWSGLMNHYYDRSKKKVKSSTAKVKCAATFSHFKEVTS